MKGRKLRAIICFLFIMIVISNFFSLAKYRSVVTGTSTGIVANWNNNIEIVGDDELILDNNSVNSKTVSFNLISGSEVASNYDIYLNYLPY